MLATPLCLSGFPSFHSIFCSIKTITQFEETFFNSNRYRAWELKASLVLVRNIVQLVLANAPPSSNLNTKIRCQLVRIQVAVRVVSKRDITIT